jgi:hypothetical protein
LTVENSSGTTPTTTQRIFRKRATVDQRLQMADSGSRFVGRALLTIILYSFRQLRRRLVLHAENIHTRRHGRNPRQFIRSS